METPTPATLQATKEVTESGVLGEIDGLSPDELGEYEYEMDTIIERLSRKPLRKPNP